MTTTRSSESRVRAGGPTPMFRLMLADLPTMELIVEPHWKPRFILRGLDALAVRT